jgi:hypothetical protein
LHFRSQRSSQDALDVLLLQVRPPLQHAGSPPLTFRRLPLILPLINGT